MQLHLLDRAKIEDQYSRSLLAACKLPPFETEGTITACWQNFTSSGSSNAGQHAQFSIMCNDVAAELEKIVTLLRQTKHSVMERHEKVSRAKDLAQRAHTKAKLVYHDCISKAEKAITELETAKASGTNAKKVPQLSKAAASCVQAVDKANLEYKKSVETLDHCEAEYDTMVLQLLDELEAVEARRLTICKAMFQRYTQHHEFLKHAVDQIQTVSFQVLQATDPELDLRNFIINTQTGAEGPLAYTAYEYKASAVIDKHRGFSAEFVGVDTKADSSADVSSSQKGKMSKTSPSATPALLPVSVPSYCPSPSPAPYPLTAPMNHEPEPPGRGRSGSNVRPSSTGIPLKLASAPAYVPSWAVTTHAYSSEEPTDLSFEIGQRIMLLNAPSNEDWWTGELTGKTGTFPKNRVKTEMVQESSPGDDYGLRSLNGTCTAILNFVGQADDEITLKVGEDLIIIGLVDGWYIGRKASDNRQGIFPCVFVKLTSSHS